MSVATALPVAQTGVCANACPKPRPTAPLILTLITLAGAWLRLSHLGPKSLWLDEGATVALARASWQQFSLVWWHGEANLQTIYFLLMRGWIHLGSSEACMRSLSAIFGIAAIPLMYVVARKFTGVTWSLAAAGAAGVQSHARLLLAGSTQLQPGDLPGAAVDVLLCARRRRRTLARLGAVDGRSARRPSTATTWPPWCWWRRRLRCSSRRLRYRGGALLLCGAIIFVAAIPGAHVCLPRVAGKPALHLDAEAEPERDLAPDHVLRQQRGEGRARRWCCGERVSRRCVRARRDGARWMTPGAERC